MGSPNTTAPAARPMTQLPPGPGQGGGWHCTADTPQLPLDFPGQPVPLFGGTWHWAGRGGPLHTHSLTPPAGNQACWALHWPQAGVRPHQLTAQPLPTPCLAMDCLQGLGFLSVTHFLLQLPGCSEQKAPQPSDVHPSSWMHGGAQRTVMWGSRWGSAGQGSPHPTVVIHICENKAKRPHFLLQGPW